MGIRERPFFNESNATLLAMSEDESIALEIIAEITYELQFRRMVSRHQKAEVVARFIALVFTDGDEPGPGFEFPEIDLSDTRRSNRSKIGDHDWRKDGVLKLSGYSVSSRDGVPERERRRILNYLFLVDDLSDIDDADYAARWGKPKSAERLQRMAKDICGFANLAMRARNDTTQAIEKWSADLGYLKTQFYDDWTSFPWPEIET